MPDKDLLEKLKAQYENAGMTPTQAATAAQSTLNQTQQEVQKKNEALAQKEAEQAAWQKQYDIQQKAKLFQQSHPELSDEEAISLATSVVEKGTPQSPDWAEELHKSYTQWPLVLREPLSVVLGDDVSFTPQERRQIERERKYYRDKKEKQELELKLRTLEGETDDVFTTALDDIGPTAHKSTGFVVALNNADRREFWEKHEALSVACNAELMDDTLPADQAISCKKLQQHKEDHYPSEDLEQGGKYYKDFAERKLIQQEMDEIRQKLGLNPIVKSQQARIKKEKEEREKQKRKEQGYEEARRFNDQCFLITNLKKVLQGVNRGRGGDVTRRPSLDGDYKNFSWFVGNNESINNGLLARPGGAQILSLCPDEIATLVPEVRIWKVFDKSAFPQEAQKSKESERSHEFVFKTNYHKANLLGKARAVGDDAGITSFTWSFQGQDHVQAPHIVQAAATYYFRNMADFVASQKVTFKLGPKGRSFRKKYRYADLAMYPAATSDYILKVRVGWSRPQKENLTGVVGNSSRRKLIHDASEASKISLYLNCINYQYDINEDGSIVVNASYRGWADRALGNTDYNIFEGDMSDLRTKEGYEIAMLKALRQMARIELRGDIGSDGYVRGVTSETARNILENRAPAALLPELKKGEVKTRRSYFMSVLNSVVSSIRPKFRPFAIKGSDARVASLAPGSRTQAFEMIEIPSTLGPNEIDLDGGARGFFGELVTECTRRIQAITSELAPILHQQLMERILHKKGNKLGVVQISKDNFVEYQRLYQEGTLARHQQFDSHRAGNFRVTRVFDGEKSLDDFMTRRTRLYTYGNRRGKIDPDKYSIYFITLGEIVDSALAHLRRAQLKNPKHEINNVGFILGSATLDIEPFSDLRNLSLADIPISMEAFQYWYITEVMEKGKVVLPIVDFVKSILNSLIVPALGSGCLGSAHLFSAERYNLTIPLHKGAAPYKPAKVYTATQVKGIRKKHKDRGALGGEGIHYSYIFLNKLTDSKLVERNGDKRKDERDSIYHLASGEECGLVKNIAFKAKDIPFLQEARDEVGYGSMDAENSHGGLMIFHDADVNMIGNTTFQPGMMVYLNPKYAGMGTKSATHAFGGKNFVSIRKINKELGIGGYYLITRTYGAIDTSGFTTTLETRFLGNNLT